MVDLSRRGNVNAFLAMDVAAAVYRRKAQGEAVISMAVGQPFACTPRSVQQAAKQALAKGQICYTESLGLLTLREAIADYYARYHGLSLSPQRIAVTTGSSAAFNLAFLAFFNPGDRVAITRPGYPAYRNIIKALGLELVEISDENKNGVLTLEALRQTHQETPLKGVLFASPANPTGASIPADALGKIIRFCLENGIHPISDEIYQRLNYTGEDVTALSYSDELTVINSFSKYYCMTGWRVGWMVVPEKAVRRIELLSQSLSICAPALSQIAALAAFDATQELEQIKDTYRENRAYLAQSLPQIGLPLLAPLDGAFYAYCDVSQFTDNSLDFATQMLEAINVAATPGIDFDPVDGKQAMRFSYAGAPEDMREAVARMADFLHNKSC